MPCEEMCTSLNAMTDRIHFVNNCNCLPHLTYYCLLIQDFLSFHLPTREVSGTHSTDLESDAFTTFSSFPHIALHVGKFRVCNFLFIQVLRPICSVCVKVQVGISHNAFEMLRFSYAKFAI